MVGELLTLPWWVLSFKTMLIALWFYVVVSELLIFIKAKKP
jgi:hypothetical protein